MRPPRTFRALRSYNFRLFWGGQLISIAGTWVQSVGQAWLVIERTDSPLALGTVTALQFLPILVLSLFAGVIVDRLPKRRLLLVTQSIAMLQSLALAVLVSTGRVELWHIYVLATVLGIANAFDNPTRQAFLFEMVGREDLVNAVALNSTLFNAARVIGPALGGLLIVKVGLAECFYINAGSFLAVLGSLLLMHEEQLHPPAQRPTGAMVGQLVEGLSYVVRTPSVFLIVILIGTVGTFGYNFTVALPLLARNVLNAGAAGFGGLSSAIGLGSLVAALTLATVPTTRPRYLFLGAGSFAALLAALALSNSYAISFTILILMGMAGLVLTVTANALMQLGVPDNLRGRVMSVYTLLFVGTTPIGGLVTGALANRWDIQWALGIEAAICVIGVLIALVYRMSVWRVSESTP